MKLSDKQIATMFITNTLRQFMNDEEYEEYSPMIIAAFQGMGVSFEELYAINFLKDEVNPEEDETHDELNELYTKGLRRLLEQSKKNMAAVMKKQHKENLN